MHYSVLKSECVQYLDIKQDGVYLDLTAGLGGHSQAILDCLSLQGRLILSDCDERRIAHLQERFSQDGRVSIYRARFSEMIEKLKRDGLRVDGVLADLGVSSMQLDDPMSGMSFRYDGPLDMRMDHRSEMTAADLIDQSSEDELAEIIFQYGEERHARRLARHIVEARLRGEIDTTKKLEEIAYQAIGRFYKGQKIHCATRLFQALRIAVNGELDELKILIEELGSFMNEKGRVAIISFHSLEDRLVKIKFKELKRFGWNVLTKRPIQPQEQEKKENSRSRSAKLRVIEAPE